ncbi:peptidyl-prolyl cis-trans isomerase FKBP8 [Eupeodes corollae]|uniref:peptidyl-prolyl cis-trans isomerase FKBP8 n=1 Tax=Eupeodes corollae TaxID=290404 RepID=UPI002492AC93|nr:peptidyl-prolyl cis-trans isomerase FKBP8 [Eupeodes corollae]XP_055919668.1 peptidyl-prolyl cis-trans isomerase FKBP8 [Eupeodes corollae]XP_055919670.1 peptidyl-prolyl cis-trans isomerase FKBP8 [Eupeodes corollae]
MDTEKSSNSSFEDLSNLNEAEMKQMKEEVEPKIDEHRVVDLLGNGQLIKKTLKKSNNPISPQRGELVKLSFTGKLDDGTVVEKEENAYFHVGDYEVVQGLDLAIPMMFVGEVAEVIVDSRFAYGQIGLKNEEDPKLSIPPDAKITYEVHLLDTKFEEHADLKNFEIRKKYGNRKKERANFWYNRNEFNIAIQLYRRALEYLDDRDGDPEANIDTEDLELSNADLQSILDDRLVVYNNLAMAQIKISAYDAALASVEHVLRCQPNNHKALYRKGRILEGKGDTKGAISLLQRAATLEPDSRTIQQDLAKLIIKARREEHNEKEMYQKMLGHAKKLEQNSKQPLKRANPESSKLKVLGYLMGSILIGVAGVAMYRYKY